MAFFRVDGDQLVVHLPWRQKLAGFHGDIQVPLTAVVSVAAVEHPMQELRGWRMAGVAFPQSISIGTRRHADGYDFCVVRRPQPAVQVDVRSGRFSRFVLSLAKGSTMLDAVVEANRIAAAAGIAPIR